MLSGAHVFPNLSDNRPNIHRERTNVITFDMEGQVSVYIFGYIVSLRKVFLMKDRFSLVVGGQK